MYIMIPSLQQGSPLTCLKGLIAFGADFDMVNDFGQSPLDLANMSLKGKHLLFFGIINYFWTVTIF